MQANQLLFQQRQGFWHPHQYAVEWAYQWLAGGNNRNRIKCMAVAHQILFQALNGQERVTAAGDVHRTDQADGQGPKTVVEHQYSAVGRQRQFGHVVEQILIRSIEGLKWLILLFRLTDQVELGERTFERRHLYKLWGIDNGLN